MHRLRSHSVYARLCLGFAALAAIAIARVSWASDHEDEASLVADPAADIADVFAFMRPGSTSHLVLALTVHPNATTGATFDPKVEYQLRVLGVTDDTVDTRVTCRFEAPNAGSQVMLCSANGHSVVGTVGAAATGDTTAPLRAWAGLRADPAFGDLAALKTTLATKQLAFADAGVNSFAGKNVLAIVVEVDVDAVLLANIDASAGRPILSVAATTERR